jgi:glycosyltransferase involved in cell wall biosynthesis
MIDMGKRLIIISNFYPGEDRGKGPWSERYRGLYEPIFRRAPQEGIESHWYELSTSKLHTATLSGFTAQPLNLRRFISSYLMDRSSDEGHILVAYPFCRGSEIFKSHSLMSVLRHSGDRILLDFVDPPLMMVAFFTGRSLTGRLLSGILRRREKDCIKLAHTLVTNSPEMGAYLKQTYGLDGVSFVDVPMGVNVSDFVPSDDRWNRDEFTIVYGGAISADRGIADLIACVERISARRPIRLLLCGRVHPSVRLPERPWLEAHPFLSYGQYATLLADRAHVGIIPYPINEWWGMVSISKAATYAAAGVPILAFDLAHTRKFISHWNCGVICKSWEEMEFLLDRLNSDRDHCREIGDNARRAAEQALSWESASKKLETHIFKTCIQ